MWPRQVIARIEGGLGNQLFQYATARSLADRLGCDLALDLRGLDVQGDRPFQLGHYATRAFIADDQLLNDLPKSRSSRWTRSLSRVSQLHPRWLSYPIFWPDSFAFDPRFDRIRQPAVLIGYWQSEKYFAWNRTQVLKDIQPLKAVLTNHPMLEQVLATSSVALHVRRGDYVSNPAAAAFHGLCDADYYQTAVVHMQAQVPNAEVFVFSDDPQWAKDQLRFGVPTHFVEIDAGDHGITDMELMCRCKHHIIANSSFSWWGAWRSEYPGQRVYAPRRWFRDTGFDTSDVIPKRWTLLA